MAKFISIATGLAAAPNVLIGTDALLGTSGTTGSVIIAGGGKTYTITTAATYGPGLLAAINTAILTTSGPLCVPVTVPASTAISAITIA
jgi:hypothetical protein